MTVSALSAGTPHAPAAEPTRLRQAVREFEAIFLRRMLAAARSADLGGDDLFGGGASGGGVDTFREMQDARFAEIAAGTGALGLATSIEAQLARYLPVEG